MHSEDLGPCMGVQPNRGGDSWILNGTGGTLGCIWLFFCHQVTTERMVAGRWWSRTGFQNLRSCIWRPVLNWDTRFCLKSTVKRRKVYVVCVLQSPLSSEAHQPDFPCLCMRGWIDLVWRWINLGIGHLVFRERTSKNSIWGLNLFLRI